MHSNSDAPYPVTISPNMCGIVAYLGKNPKLAKEAVINQHQEQYNRGKEGFGVIEVTQSKVIVRRATEPIKFAFDLRESNSGILIAHHRMPTSTENKMQQTHPIIVDNPELSVKYYIIHNGVIGNATALKEKHNKLGYKYTTEIKTSYSTYKNFNDSEALAIELARYLDNKDDHIKTSGLASFVIVTEDKKTKAPLDIYWGRNTQQFDDLEMPNGDLLIASELIGSGIGTNAIYKIQVKDVYAKKNKVVAAMIEELDTKEAFKPMLASLATTTTAAYTTTHYNKYGKSIEATHGLRPGTEKPEPKKDTALVTEVGSIHSGPKKVESVTSEPIDWSAKPQTQEQALERMRTRIMDRIEEMAEDICEALIAGEPEIAAYHATWLTEFIEQKQANIKKIVDMYPSEEDLNQEIFDTKYTEDVERPAVYSYKDELPYMQSLEEEYADDGNYRHSPMGFSTKRRRYDL